MKVTLSSRFVALRQNESKVLPSFEPGQNF